MKIKFISVYSRILSFLLVLLGFSSCDNSNDDDGGGMVAMYGTPSANFVVKGKVVDDENKAVSGLKVAIGSVYNWSGTDKTYYADSINTDVDGAFKVSIMEFPKDQNFVIKYEDVDNEEDGLLKSVTDTVRFKNPSFTNGDNNWYSGEATKDLGTVVFDPKKSAE